MRMAGLALITVTFTPSAAYAASPSSPAQISASIAARGAKPTIDDLARNDQWDAVVDAIGAGKASWVALAPQLAPGSSAGSAEDLGIALAFALPKNAPAVLGAIDPNNGTVLGVDRVCGQPFIEDTEPHHYLSRVMMALTGVTDPRLAQVKSACLATLKRSSKGR